MDRSPVEQIRNAVEGDGAEVDDTVDILLNRGRKLTWREINTIRENGYKIQDVYVPREGGDDRVRVRCVTDSQRNSEDDDGD